MIRVLALVVVVALTSVSQAATVKFSGTYDQYVSISGAADPAGLLNRSFLATLETDGGSNILSGQMWFSGPAQTVVLNGGTISIGGSTTTFGGISSSLGTTVQFQLSQALPNLTQQTFLNIAEAGVGGSSTLSGGFGTGNGVYIASITAVPEPSAALFLGAMVLGCGLMRRRRA